jgi:hypothetical protein
MDPRQPKRVPAFPARRLFALVDTDAALHGALRALAPHVAPADLRVLTGENGVRALDVSGATHGLRGRMMRAVQDLAYSRSSLDLHAIHMDRGGHLLLIRARTWGQCQQLVEVLTDWGAHGLVWFSRSSVVDVTPRYCAATGRAVTGHAVAGHAARGHAVTGRAVASHAVPGHAVPVS